jgi:outer membrane receptor protein involved in Fe transport
MSPFRARLLSTTLVTSFTIGLICSTPSLALAQDAATPPPDGNAVEEVIVTGTRLRLPDYVQANPIVSIDSQAIALSGATNIGEFLKDTPALVSSQDLADGADTSTPDQAGLNLLNLRNLGTDRTLVLVNGRRHVAGSSGTSAVDINTIPEGLIDRVEVLTGGASAVYGADGVSGVVNFILKKNFEGLDLRAQHTWTDEGGGGDDSVGLVAGKNFNDGRGNVTFAVDYSKQKRLKFSDRDYTRLGQRQILISNPDDPGTFGDPDDPAIFDNVLARNVRYIDSSPGGSIYTNFGTTTTHSGVSFLGNGAPFIDGEYAGGFFMIGGSGSLLDSFNDDLIPGLERYNFNLNGRYELTDRLAVFGEAKFAETKTGFSAQPSYDYGLFLSADNPYMPASVRADASEPGGLIDDPDGNGLPAAGVLMARDNFDLGTQGYDIDRKTYRFAGGLEGSFNDNISFEVSGVYGRSELKQEAFNVRINERFFAASDVVINPANGQPTCRSNLDPTAAPYGDLFAQFPFDPSTFGSTFTPGVNSGCVPLNVFGAGSPSQAAIDWVNTTATDNTILEQTVLNGFVSGDTSDFFSLPAGALSFVLGAEYRQEKSDFRPDAIELLADALEYPITTVGRASRTTGKFDVKEVFAELSAPLLKDLPWAKELTLQGAYRYSDYSTSGGASTWNFGGRWRPSAWFMLRATSARAVRAPNINNLFQGRQQTFAAFADPCSVENLGLGENPTLRAQNCATTLTALGVDPTSFINNSSESIGGFIQGNPELKPEKADTFTVGFVLTPSFAKGLSISVDYYDIKIRDAIQSFTAQTIVNNCYDLAQPNSFCDLISRSPSGTNPGRIDSFLQIPGNLANYLTAGIDMTARYELTPSDFGVERDIGKFRFSLVGNWLNELTFQQTATAAPTNDRGAIDAPEWQGSLDVTWLYKKLTVNYGFNYFNQTRRFSLATMRNEPDYVAADQFYYKARKVHDAQVRYEVLDKISVYAGGTNLTDETPDFSEYTYPVSPLGRTFYVGLNAKF